MSTTLPHGIIQINEGNIAWYGDITANWQLIDTARTIAAQERAQYEGLGDRWVLYYFTEEEVAEVDRAWRLDAEKLHGPDDFTAGYGIGPYGLMRYGLF